MLDVLVDRVLGPRRAISGAVSAGSIADRRRRNGTSAPGVCRCRTSAPRSRNDSEIRAANRPVEELTILRTSSIGATVPPPVTTTSTGSGMWVSGIARLAAADPR